MPSLPPPQDQGSSARSRPQSDELVLPERLAPESRPRAALDELDGPVPLGGNLRGATETADVYWPLDLLPDACPDARVFTFGYETLVAEGQLVPGQMDVFERGRHLLEGMEELRRVGGRGREVVLVAHSTGAIIVKEVGGIYSLMAIAL